MTPVLERKRPRRRPEPAAKFWCDFCQRQTVTRVLETRGERRRRECLDCGGTYPTKEFKVGPGRKLMHRPPSKQQPLPLPASRGR